MSIFSPQPRTRVVIDGATTLVARSWDAFLDVFWLRDVLHDGGLPLEVAIDRHVRHDVEIYADDVRTHALEGVKLDTDGEDIAIYAYTARRTA